MLFTIDVPEEFIEFIKQMAKDSGLTATEIILNLCYMAVNDRMNIDGDA